MAQCTHSLSNHGSRCIVPNTCDSRLVVDTREAGVSQAWEVATEALVEMVAVVDKGACAESGF